MFDNEFFYFCSLFILFSGVFGVVFRCLVLLGVI
jgi:hypothetical protein|nr:MAG TPA: hypothetical protein [Inoviridae sp.]